MRFIKASFLGDTNSEGIYRMQPEGGAQAAGLYAGRVIGSLF